MFPARLLPPIPPNTSRLFLRLFLLSLPLSLRQFSAALPPPPLPPSSYLPPCLFSNLVSLLTSFLASARVSRLLRSASCREALPRSPPEIVVALTGSSSLSRQFLKRVSVSLSEV